MTSLALVSAAAVHFFYRAGYTLYYGDALAHLVIARRMIDSRTPGWDQVGTAWLPLPHVVMLPLVGSDWLWRTGLAGAIPSAACYVIAGTFLFLAARRIFASAAVAAAACLLVALNPNVLYLQSIPMTEAVFLACLTGLLYFSVLFRDTQSLWAAAAAGVSALAGTLTRYDAWMLLPFGAGYFLIAARKRRFISAAVFCAIAALGPLYWLAHNWWYFGHALEFYSGRWSAKAIQGAAPYPGHGDWRQAWIQYSAAVRLVVGGPLAWVGLIGIAAALLRRAFWPLLLLALVPMFYIWNLHSGDSPIFVPHLWPHSYYNTRYALGALPLLALGAAALASLAPARWRGLAAVAVVAIGIAPWLAYPRPESWICWKESQVNSDGRRAWTRAAARYLAARYAPRDGIVSNLSDVAGIYLEAGIPLRAVLHEGNNPQYDAAVQRPDLFLRERWAVAISGDTVATAAERLRRPGPRYDLVETITIKGAPVIKIFRRVDEHPLHEGARRQE